VTGKWPVKALGDVCHVIGGGTPPKDKEHYFRGTIPWATVRDMRKDVIAETEFQITEEAVSASSTNIIPAHNVVIATRVGLGKVCFVERDTAINQDLRGIIPMRKSELSVHYLFWWLKSIAHLIVQEGTGATVQGVKLPFIKSLEIPLPPLAEQQRISAILDKAFAGIAAATANAEKNLANARELFTSHLNSVFEETADDWDETSLGAEAELLVGFAFKSAGYTVSDDGVRLLRGDNIVPGSIRWEDEKRWPQSDVAQYSRYKLLAGDIVLAMDRPWIKAGLKHAMLSNSDLPSLLVQRTACLRKGPGLENRFLLYLVRSTGFARHLLGVQTGIGVPHISGKQIQDFRFKKPPLDEQRVIVDTLERLDAETKRLELTYQRKLTALSELKQAILKKAFSGELAALPEEALYEEAA
jgi:type I restriction enzyme S subunit